MCAYRRLAAALATVAAGLALLAPPAGAHARLRWSYPAAGAHVGATAGRARLRFSEPVLLVRGADLALVDTRGRTLATASRPAGGGAAATLTLPLGRRLAHGGYALRYRVLSDDGHEEAAVIAFAVGAARVSAGTVARPSAGSTGAAAVLARFLEIVALGAMLSVLAFGCLVWRPALADARLGPAVRARVHDWGAARLWVGFWAAALVSVGAEFYVVLSQAATAFGVGPGGPLAHPADVSTVLRDTRFGAVFEIRCALLAVLLVAALAAFLADARRGGRSGRRAPAVLLALLAAYVLGTLSYQGHAAQAPFGALSVLDDAVHLSAVSVWIGGLGLLAMVLTRAPRALGGGGDAVARATLVRFSRVASVAVAVALISGLLRAGAELTGPAQLVGTPYGRTIVLKLGLLVPVLALAWRNRRLAASMRTAGADAMPAIARGARMELLLSLALVLAAALLVGEAPGRPSG